jgi:hypothetical protein
MALIFGNTRPDGLIQVTEVQYQRDSDPRGGYRVNAEDIPDYPPLKPKIGYTMLFNPENSEFIFEEGYRQPTTEESLAEVSDLLKDILQTLKEK